MRDSFRYAGRQEILNYSDSGGGCENRRRRYFCSMSLPEFCQYDRTQMFLFSCKYGLYDETQNPQDISQDLSIAAWAVKSPQF